MTTLADMTQQERAQCRGVWCEEQDGSVCIYMGDIQKDDRRGVFTYPASMISMGAFLSRMTPLFDLPRAWTPDGQPPAGEWEHAEYLGDYKGMTDVYHLDGDPTHRRFVGEWEKA